MLQTLPPQPQSSLEWALHYHSLGFSVVPVMPGEKLPAVQWARYQTTRATPEQIRAWFGGSVDFGVGIVTGAVSGIFALDFDGDEGAETRDRLEAKGLPAAPEALTGGGGNHLLFRHPGRPVGTVKRLLPGMDVRGDGGFIVAAPSLHANGRLYAWSVDAGLDDLAIPEAPADVVDLVCSAAGHGEANSAEVVHIQAPGTFGLPEDRISDGRETYMRDTVLAVCRDLTERLGRTPSEDELTDAAWQQYSRKVDLSRPGRGKAELRNKAVYLLGRIAAGKVDMAAAPKPAQSPAEGAPPLPNFITDAKGNLIANANNVAELLLRHAETQGLIATDLFANRVVLLRQLPNVPGPREFSTAKPLRDEHASALLVWVQRHGIPKATPAMLATAIDIVAANVEVHPVRSYLTQIKWDGVCRLDTWLTDYCGAVARTAEDRQYLRGVGRAWMIAAVARIFEPGCKADNALILEGLQGIGKSTVAAVLAGEGWFGDALPHMGTKDAQSYVCGLWIVEMAELANMAKAEVEVVKAFLSRREDRFRPAYGRYEKLVPRQCVFIGTTNSDDYLRDTTGNRRFWPVRCGVINLDALREDRDQLWAEAVHAYRNEEGWWIDRQTAALAEVEQASRVDNDDPLTGDVLRIASGHEEAGICIAQIVAQLIPDDQRRDRTPLLSKRIGRILRTDGWTMQGFISPSAGYGKQRRYVKEAKQ